MLTLIFNWQNYFAANIALVLAYLALRPLLRTAMIQKHVSQRSQLNLMRRLLAALVLIFAVMPFIVNLRPLPVALDMPPLFFNAPGFMSPAKENLVMPFVAANPAIPNIAYGEVFMFFWLAGVLIHSFRYGRNIMTLVRLKQHACTMHKIGRIHLLVSLRAQSVFCFSLLSRHYIVLPESCLANARELRMSVRHELQHLRQHDTYWLHILSLLTIFCFWNPVILLWANWCKELQEYACDEALVLNNKNSLSDYAQCLVNAARNSITQGVPASEVLAMNGGPTSIIYRRVSMLFNYKPIRKKFVSALIYGVSLLGIVSSAYAVNNLNAPLNSQDVSALINASYARAMHISAEPEVVDELNRIRSDQTARDKMHAALERMKIYQPAIAAETQYRHIPADLIAMPLLQSAFQPQARAKNPPGAVGLWQIIPSTARNLGLKVDDKEDERLDPQLSTQAALDYLQNLYAQFRDWKLAVMAYELGEGETERLIKATGSRNAWVIARSSYVPKNVRQEVKFYLANFDASVIILHHPEVI